MKDPNHSMMIFYASFEKNASFESKFKISFYINIKGRMNRKMNGLVENRLLYYHIYSAIRQG